jgi:hypothetical protein
VRGGLRQRRPCPSRVKDRPTHVPGVPVGTPDLYYWRGLEAATLIETGYRFASPGQLSSTAKSSGVARDNTIASNGPCPLTARFGFMFTMRPGIDSKARGVSASGLPFPQVTLVGEGGFEPPTPCLQFRVSSENGIKI